MTKIQRKKKRNNFALCLDFAEQNTYYRVESCAPLSKRSVQIPSSFSTKRFGAYVASRCHRIILEIDGSPSLKYAHMCHDSTKTAFHNLIYIYIYIKETFSSVLSVNDDPLYEKREAPNAGRRARQPKGIILD